MSNVLHFPTPIAAQPDDATARQLALDIHASCIVEAPAGSGKTGLLVQRLLKLLADSEDLQQPEEVLAITFTNKATAELRERVLRELQTASHTHALPADASPFDLQTHALAAAVLGRSHHLDWRLLERPHRLNIRSIDSVCAEIANALPLISGSGPRQPVEDARPLYRLAARRTLLQLGGADLALHQALRNILLHRDGNLADCETLLADMLASREQWGELIPLSAEELDDHLLDTHTRPKLERTLEAIVCAGLSRALNAMPAGLLHELTAIAARLGLAPGYKDKPSPISLCATLHEPPADAAEHLDHWRALIYLLLKPSDSDWRSSYAAHHIGFEIPKADATYLKQLVTTIQADDLRHALAAVRDLPPARYPDDQWAVAKALFLVLRHALTELKLLFAERGECDFTEFALNARAALEEEFSQSPSDATATDLALSTGGHLRHLLVDEMQDTSSGQYELIRLLTRSWDGGSQTLFLVGDPKQSIYLFRQARVERFLRTMREQRLGDLPLRALRLTANFRSQATLVHGFNAAFQLVFPSPQNPGPNDVPFVAATPTRPPSDSPGILWHPTLLTDETSPTYNADEARTLRYIIEERLATPLPPGRTRPWRIAVLARARTHLAEIVAEFKRDRGNGPLAFRAVDLDTLVELPEVLDALALTRALLHPADRIAWLAVLRAPWCGLSLADLLALTGEGPGSDPTATVPHLVATRSHLLSPVGRQLLHRVWPTLQTAAATVGQTPFSVHIERTWRSLGADTYLSQTAQKHVAQYIELILEGELKSANIDLKTLENRLQTLYAEPMSGDVQVELLTMHKAKGLEWDVVLVPGLHRRPNSSRSSLLNWLEVESNEQDASILLAPIWERGTDSDSLNKWLSKTRASREIAEVKRLFYVAATRSREELHLFAATSKNSSLELKKTQSNTLFNACFDAFAPHFFTDPTTLPAEDELYPLTLAATASEPHSLDALPGVQRLPLSFDPGARFVAAAHHRLAYPDTAPAGLAPAFERPEGSFGVRAFGNVVHRYLQLLADQLAASNDPAALLTEVQSWQPRLTASLRSEGLSPQAAARQAERALRALHLTLEDPLGRWVLAPHEAAASEMALGSLRVDRTFLAGHTPGSYGTEAIWIVDFKTTDPGSRSTENFELEERSRYTAQLEAYARLRRALPGGGRPIYLGLYYPLSQRLLSWKYAGAAQDPATT